MDNSPEPTDRTSLAIDPYEMYEMDLQPVYDILWRARHEDSKLEKARRYSEDVELLVKVIENHREELKKLTRDISADRDYDKEKLVKFVMGLQNQLRDLGWVPAFPCAGGPAQG